MSVVYGLIHSESLEIRYVGITKHSAEYRLKGHINDAKYGSQRHVHKWIRSLPSLPNVVVLERSPEDLQKSEIDWISRLRLNGARLTNGTDGGDGILNPTPEVRAKLSNWQIGRRMSDTAKAKMSESRKGKVSNRKGVTLSEDTKQKIRLANLGKIQSLETRKKRSVSMTGKHWELSEEARKRISESKIGRNGYLRTAEIVKKTSNSVKQNWASLSDDQRKERCLRISQGRMAANGKS